MLSYPLVEISDFNVYKLQIGEKGGEKSVSKKLYVGNLPYQATTDSLRTHFSQAGTVVDAVVIMDKRTNRSKGFGFVEFEKDEEASKAIEMFNQKDFEGRALVVNEARPQEPRD